MTFWDFADKHTLFLFCIAYLLVYGIVKAIAYLKGYNFDGDEIELEVKK